MHLQPTLFPDIHANLITTHPIAKQRIRNTLLSLYLDMPDIFTAQKTFVENNNIIAPYQHRDPCAFMDHLEQTREVFKTNSTKVNIAKQHENIALMLASNYSVLNIALALKINIKPLKSYIEKHFQM